MKIISNEKTDTNIVELEIQVDGEQLQKAADDVYKEQRGDIAIPGFRKGKAPRKLIERMYGEDFFLNEAINNLYPDIYAKAIDETGIEPVAPGDVEVTEVDPEKGFVLKATITVKPEVTVKDYKGIKAEKVIRTATDEDVESEIERLRERGARLIEVSERAAKEGDTAIIDFEGFVDDVAFEGGKGEGHNLVLGSNSFIEGFEEQIIGKEIGDNFDVNVTFPEEYHAEDLAGKPAVFKVKLHELKEKELPELDDEFAKDVSEFDTLEELKKDLKENIQKSFDMQDQDKFENQLVTKIIENMEGEIPEVMYEGRIDQMMQDFAQRLAQQGMNMELYLQYTGMDMDSFRDTFREEAERQVKIQLALEEIVKLEDIKPAEEDLNAEYKRLAEMYQMEEDQIRSIIPEDNISLDVANGMAVDLIRDSAKVTEVKEEDVKNEETEEKED